MAEFLIYKGGQWMDVWSDSEVAALDAMKKAKYHRRFQLGDFIEVQNDGKWSGGITKDSPFYCLSVSLLKKEDGLYLCGVAYRDYYPEEVTYHSDEVDKIIVEMQKTEIINVIETKQDLMTKRLDKKSISHRRRYGLDFAKLTVEENKTFTDGNPLVIDSTRFSELVKDKMT